MNNRRLKSWRRLLPQSPEQVKMADDIVKTIIVLVKYSCQKSNRLEKRNYQHKRLLRVLIWRAPLKKGRKSLKLQLQILWLRMCLISFGSYLNFIRMLLWRHLALNVILLPSSHYRYFYRLNLFPSWWTPYRRKMSKCIRVKGRLSVGLDRSVQGIKSFLSCSRSQALTVY